MTEILANEMSHGGDWVEREYRGGTADPVAVNSSAVPVSDHHHRRQRE